jgi:hypothetical protein
MDHPKVVHGLDTVIDPLESLLERTIHANESNSIVVLGAPKCGKSLVVRTALDRVCKGNEVRILKLHGDAHQDEKLAARTLAKQLNLTGEYDQRGFVRIYTSPLCVTGDLPASCLDLGCRCIALGSDHPLCQ